MSPPALDPSPADPPALRTIEVGGLRQQIAEVLREGVWSGALRPGQRLNELRLAGQIGVSRPPLREAIRVLEQEGLVESIPRRGTFVRVFSARDISEIYAVRCALESMAAELAIGRATPDALDGLEEKLDRLEGDAQGNLGDVIARDFEFHRALVRLPENSRLIALWEQLAGQLRLALTLVDPAFFQSDYVESTHRALVGAIRQGDAPAAVRLSRTLLEVGRNLSERWAEHVTLRGSGEAEAAERPVLTRPV